ncbi:MAG: hypothetical protein C4527_17390 [Candidatus Omnitrophota bacterium]|jgi:tetratricopeptide (TPR) repeat protein|nr:MAG: hypothetical protein C4527_17390 [Candidatus Omnitrophota bacterium]
MIFLPFLLLFQFLLSDNEVLSGSNRLENLLLSLHRGELQTAEAALASLSGFLTDEEKNALMREIDRLSPGAEWIPFLHRLAEKNQEDGDFLFLIARAHWRSGNVDAAMHTCAEITSKSPDDVNLLYQAAALAHTVDRITEARNWITTLLSKEPEHTDGLFLFGRIQASEGKDAEARETLQHVLKQNPRHYLARYELGRLENRAGNSEAAELHLRASVKEFAFFNEAYNALLVALARQKKQAEVKEIQAIVNHLNTFSQAKRDRLRHAFFHPAEINAKDAVELAYELSQVKRDDLARVFLTRLFEMNRCDDTQIVLLAHLQYKAKDFAAALHLLERVQDQRILQSESYLALKAWALFLTGKVEESRTFYQTIDAKMKQAAHFQELEKAYAQQEGESVSAATNAQGPFQFVDVTERCGLSTFKHVLGHADKRWIIDAMGSGVAVGDYDNDGDDDIYFVNGRSQADTPNPAERNRLFRNDGGIFVDVTDEAGVGDMGYGMSAIFGDINNDGWIDLFVGNYGPNVLYLNNGDGTFTDITAKAGVCDDGYVAATSFGDVDRDGDLDLFIGNYVAFDPKQHADVRDGYHGISVFRGPLGFEHQNDILYINDGTGVFKDASDAAGVNVSPGRAMGAVFFDMDNDRDLDLYVTNDSTYNHVLQNRGEGTFEDISFLSGGAFTESGVEGASMGVIAGDYNNDGFLDLFITSYEHQSDVLYQNDGKGNLIDVTGPVGLVGPTHWLITWGSGFCDFDADGFLDIFTANGHIYPQIEDLNVNRHYAQGLSFYRNTGERFEDVTDGALSPDFKAKGGRGAALLDFDNDGDMDIVVNCMDSTPQLLENRSPRGHWLKVTLDAPSALAYGVRVTARKGDRTWTRSVDGGSGYLSHSSRNLFFGFGDVDTIDDLTIHWMHRAPHVIAFPALDRHLIVVASEK